MFATLATFAAVPAASPIAADLPCGDPDMLPGGCGWFDSSLDLSRGLAVVEHAGFDAIGDVAPLAWQLADWL
jgi:hypothetical protein